MNGRPSFIAIANGSLGLAVFSPFIKSVRRNEATPLCESHPEREPPIDRLGSGVDGPLSNLWILRLSLSLARNSLLKPVFRAFHLSLLVKLYGSASIARMFPTNTWNHSGSNTLPVQFALPSNRQGNLTEKFGIRLRITRVPGGLINLDCFFVLLEVALCQTLKSCSGLPQNFGSADGGLARRRP